MSVAYEKLHIKIKEKESIPLLLPDLRNLTPSQKQLALELTSGKDKLEAGREVFKGKKVTDKQITTWVDESLEKPQTKREILRIMNECKLGEKFLVEKLLKILQSGAKYDTKLRGIDMGFKLHGSYAPQKSVSVEGKIDLTPYAGQSDEQLKDQIRQLLDDPQVSQSET